jgi:hypothetical protein
LDPAGIAAGGILHQAHSAGVATMVWTCEFLEQFALSREEISRDNKTHFFSGAKFTHFARQFLLACGIFRALCEAGRAKLVEFTPISDELW